MSRRVTFPLLVFLAGIVTALFHEFGHCVFHWLQGIPAAMSLVKEYPLRDITAHEYAIGSVGGPLAGLAGLDYRAMVVLYAIVVACSLAYHVKVAGARVGLFTTGSFLALFVGYVFVMVGVETLDASLLWKRFPAIQIDDGRTYNPRR